MSAKTMKSGILVAVLLVSLASVAVGQDTVANAGAGWGNEFIHGILASLIYSILGLIVLMIGFKVLDVVTPFSLNKEIAEDDNVAAGVVVAGLMIGLGVIIAAAIL